MTYTIKCLVMCLWLLSSIYLPLKEDNIADYSIFKNLFEISKEYYQSDLKVVYK